MVECVMHTKVAVIVLMAGLESSVIKRVRQVGSAETVHSVVSVRMMVCVIRSQAAADVHRVSVESCVRTVVQRVSMASFVIRNVIVLTTDAVIGHTVRVCVTRDCMDASATCRVLAGCLDRAVLRSVAVYSRTL